MSYLGRRILGLGLTVSDFINTGVSQNISHAIRSGDLNL